MLVSGNSGAGLVSEELVGKLRRLSLEVDRAKPAAAPSRRTKNAGTAAACLAIATALFLAGRYSSATVSAESPSSSGVAATATAAAPPRSLLSASGYVVAKRRATIAAQVTGQIRSIHVQQGQHVDRGQLLARLDSASARAAFENAGASAAAADAAVSKLNAQLESANENRQRVEALFARGFATKRELTSARTSAAAASADLLQARAMGAASAASASGAGVTLSRYDIRAPFSGVVVDLNAQPGEVISPVSAGGGFTRTGICTIVDMTSLEVEVDVPEAYIARVVPGMPVSGALDAFPRERLAGHVLAIVPIADRGKASLKVRIKIDRAPAQMMPEMAVRVEFEEAGARAARKGG